MQLMIVLGKFLREHKNNTLLYILYGRNKHEINSPTKTSAITRKLEVPVQGMNFWAPFSQFITLKN